MKRYLNIILTIVLAVAAGIASFYISRSAAEASASAPEDALSHWLDLTPAQQNTVELTEADFRRKAAELSEAFRRERQILAQLLENTQSSDDQILAQVETVIAAHDNLLQHVVRYILSVRDHLEAGQKAKLLHLCGRMVRGRPAQGRLRGSVNGNSSTEQPRRGIQRRRGWGPGQGRGQGWRRDGSGGGQGPGQGQGRRGRRWQGFAPSLALTPEQMQIAKDIDPGYEEESQTLHEKVRLLQEQFAQRLENPDSPDEEVWQRLQEFTTAYHRLEQRTAQHMVLLRSHLTPDQQKILVGLCADCGRQ